MLKDQKILPTPNFDLYCIYFKVILYILLYIPLYSILIASNTPTLLELNWVYLPVKSNYVIPLLHIYYKTSHIWVSNPRIAPDCNIFPSAAQI